MAELQICGVTSDTFRLWDVEPLAGSDQSYNSKPVAVVTDHSSANCRGEPFWPQCQIVGRRPLEAAAQVLEQMLEKDPLNQKQKSDFEFLVRILREDQGTPVVGRRSVICMGDELHDVINTSEVDKSTLDFLKSFGEDNDFKKKPPTFRQVVMMVKFSLRIRNVLELKSTYQQERAQSVHFSPVANKVLMAMLITMDDWGSFDIFDIVSLCGPTAVLQHVAMVVFDSHNFMREFSISPLKLLSFLVDIEGQYQDHRYHNSIHAADVVQTVNMIQRSLNPGNHLSELEELAMLFAAACHDVGHPGYTNNFRVATRDEGALTYNDRSVNENMHCSVTYRSLTKSENNWCDRLSPIQTKALRKQFIDIILATDMSFHFKKVAKIKSQIEVAGSSIHKWKDASLGLEFMVHAADISNVTKPMPIALKWCDRVLDEFFAQGDKERSLGINISPLCDRHTVSKADSQCAFVNFIVSPTYELLSNFCDVTVAIENMKAYKLHFLAPKEEAKTSEANVKPLAD